MSKYDPYKWGCDVRTLHLKGRVDIEICSSPESNWGRVLIKCDGIPCIEMECTDPSSIMWRLIKNEGL